MKIKGLGIIILSLLLMSFVLTFGTLTHVEAKDFIQWKGAVFGIKPPQQTGTPPSEAALSGARISIAQYPSVFTTSDANGIFTIAGIPSSNFYYFRVSKDLSTDKYIPTNVGVNIGNQDIDNSMCFGTGTGGTPTCCPAGVAECLTNHPGLPTCSGAGTGTPGMGTCTFLQKLFAVSQDMVTYIQSISPTDIDLTTKGMVLLRLQDSTGVALDINTASAIFSVNGAERPPQGIIKLLNGNILIPNVAPGDTTITIENVTNTTIPPIVVPAFVGEITFYLMELISNPGTITGRVTNESGSTGIAGALVQATPDGLGTSATAVTGSTGSYSMQVSQGSYRVSASSAGLAQQYYSMTDRWDWATSLWVGPNMSATNIDFKLSVSYSIEGTVSAGGTPMANVFVSANSSSAQVGYGSQTDANGNYKISVKPASDYKVNVTATDYPQQYYNGKKDWMNADLVDVSTGNKTGINFNLSQGRKVSGTVSSQSGPIAYASVNAWSDSLGAGGYGNTDSTGLYSITVQPANDYKISVNAPNFPIFFYNGKTSWDTADLVDLSIIDRTNINFTLSSGKTISGAVKSGSTGIADITVNAFSPFGFGTAQTDSSGNYSISVPAGMGYRLEAFSSTYPRVMWKGTFTQTNSSTMTGVGNSTTTAWNEAGIFDTNAFNYIGIDFILSSGVSISGQVTKNDGTAIQGAMVNAWSDQEMTWGGTNTDGQGKFSFKTPLADGYKINISHPDYPVSYYKIPDGDLGTCATNCSGDTETTTNRWDEATVFNFKSDSRLTDASGNKVAKGVDFKLGTKGGSISGTVKAYGKPLAGVWVNAFSQQGGYGAGEPTAANGTYKIKVQPGFNYNVEVWSDKFIHQFYNGKFDWLEADPVYVADNEDKQNIDFNLSLGNTISGTVKSGSNVLPGVWVNAWSESKASGAGAQTDSTGAYTINLKPAPDYKVGVYDPNYPAQFYNKKSDWMQADPVDISSGSKSGIDFDLSRGTEIKGTVTKSGGGVPEADATGNRGWVNAWSEATGSSTGSPVDSSGSYTLKVQPASDYKVQVFHPNYASQFYNGVSIPDLATPVDATSTRTGIDFVLSSGGTIKGKISDNSGPKSGIWVNANSETMMFGMGNSTDANGDYEIKGLLPGPGYKVSIWSPEYANVFYSSGNVNGTSDLKLATALDLTGGVTLTNKDITLSSGGTITGTVKVSSGTLSGFIRVDTFSESLTVGRGEPLKYGAGATSASFSLKGLPSANDYRVQVTADSFINTFFVSGNSNGTADWAKASKYSVSGNTVDSGEVILGSGGSISGTIYIDATKSADKVVRSGWVQAMNPDRGEYVGTSISYNGTYEVKGLTAGSNYTVQTTADGYTPVFYDPTKTNSTSSTWVAPNVIATSDGTKGIDMVVSLGHTISGKVLDASGNGIPYAFVGVFDASPNTDGTDLSNNKFYGSPMADGGGNYKTPTLPDGNYILTATATTTGGVNLGKAFYKDTSNNNSKILALAGADKTNINIQFQDPNARGKITGTITNSSGGAFQEIQVMVYKAVDGKLAQSKSKASIANGGTFQYEISVDPGTYKVRAMGFVQGGQPKKKFYDNVVSEDKEDATSVKVDPGQVRDNISITLQ